MRPTVAEQLHGTCRILETVVAPCVSDPLARTILDNLVANLRMLTDAQPKVAGFLRADNAATLDQLVALCPALGPELVARIDGAGVSPAPDVDDAATLDARNRVLRGLLAEAVCQPDLPPELCAAVERYMIDRASRVPMRYVPTVAPASPSPARI